MGLGRARLQPCRPEPIRTRALAPEGATVYSFEAAAKLHQIRVIDESSEDYLYLEEYFVTVQLPQSAEKAIWRAAVRG
jgi:hypothetical protein